MRRKHSHQCSTPSYLIFLHASRRARVREKKIGGGGGGRELETRHTFFFCDFFVSSSVYFCFVFLCVRVFFSSLRAWPGLAGLRAVVWSGHSPVSPSQGHQGASLDWTHQGTWGSVFRTVWRDSVKDPYLSDLLLPQCKDEGNFKQNKKCLWRYLL